MGMGMSVGQGFLAGQDAKSKAGFQADQMENMKIFAAAAGSREEGRIRREFKAQSEANMGAAALSGLAAVSFGSIQTGNNESERQALEDTYDNVDREQASLEIQKKIALMNGKIEARSAMFAGVTKAAGIGMEAEDNFQKNRSDDNGLTRKEYFKSYYR